MRSRDQIKSVLKSKADNYGYKGEAVDMIIDMLTYVAYNNQIEVLNASQESSLSTSKSINSKIKQCVDLMYSVYRGKNARVKLLFRNKTLLTKNKFDLLYESNTFKIYAENVFRFDPSTIGPDGRENVYLVTGILSKESKYVTEVEVTSNNKYFIDVKLDGFLLSNISEDIKVSIDGLEYPTTRNFYDHVNQPIYNPNEEISDSNPLDKLFVLTIPDYGVRIFKKGYIDHNGEVFGYFEVNKVVRIECLTYTRADEINIDEFNKIIIPGTELVMDDPSIPPRTLVQEVKREDSNSILYNANFSTRTQSEILSVSDINVLFTEYFIDEIENSINWYDVQSDNLYVYYVPRNKGFELPAGKVTSFIQNYKSYFITQSIVPIKGVLITVYVTIELYINDSTEISHSIQSIFNRYSHVLNPKNATKSFMNLKPIISEISRLPSVAYVDDLVYSKYLIEGRENSVPYPNYRPDDWLPTEVDGVPAYYEFELTINYKNSYETLS